MHLFNFIDFLDSINLIILSLLFVSFGFLCKEMVEQNVQYSIEHVEIPELPYRKDDYAYMFVSCEKDEQMMRLLEEPQIKGSFQDTPFPGIKVVSFDHVAPARKIIPDLWVQPIHPLIGEKMIRYVNDTNATMQEQAAKAMDSGKHSDTLQYDHDRLIKDIERLKESNTELNKTLISMRSRSRGSSTGVDFGQMNLEELNNERERLMEAIRRIDSIRTQMLNPKKPEKN
jgi:hypothetical protein